MREINERRWLLGMTSSTTSSSPSVHPGRWFAGLLAALLLAGGAVYWMKFRPGDEGEPAPVAVGATGRDGSLEFVVSGVKCGTKTVGAGADAISAQGVYCLAAVRVTNVGGGPQHFDGAAQKITDDTGTQYVSDTAADLKANDEAWSSPLPPGAARTGHLIFDVPLGTKPAELELHETLLSTGIRVSLH